MNRKSLDSFNLDLGFSKTDVVMSPSRAMKKPRKLTEVQIAQKAELPPAVVVDATPATNISDSEDSEFASQRKHDGADPLSANSSLDPRPNIPNGDVSRNEDT